MRCLDACEARDLWLKSDAREGADRKSKSDASSEGARGSEAHMSTGSEMRCSLRFTARKRASCLHSRPMCKRASVPYPKPETRNPRDLSERPCRVDGVEGFRFGVSRLKCGFKASGQDLQLRSTFGPWPSHPMGLLVTGQRLKDQEGMGACCSGTIAVAGHMGACFRGTSYRMSCCDNAYPNPRIVSQCWTNGRRVPMCQ